MCVSAIGMRTFSLDCDAVNHFRPNAGAQQLETNVSLHWDHIDDEAVKTAKLLAADAVEQATGARPEVALLKGWQNYLCRHRLDGGYPQEENEAALFGVGDAISQPAAGHGSDASLGEQVVRLREWAARTDTGDRDDLVPGVSQRAWAQVSVSGPSAWDSPAP